MQPNDQQTPPVPPKKLVDFNDELKALCAKYQYELRVVHIFDPLQGHQAIIQAFDVSPKDAGVQLNPTEPAPANPVPETPAVEVPKDPNASGEAANPSPSPEANAAVDSTLKN